MDSRRPRSRYRSRRSGQSWFDGYVRTYLERDLQDLASISALPDFRRLMRATRDSRLERAEIGYWWTVNGEEVDLVIEEGGKLLPMEIKATTRPRLSDAVHLRSFRAEYGKKSAQDCSCTPAPCSNGLRLTSLLRLGGECSERFQVVTM